MRTRSDIQTIKSSVFKNLTFTVKYVSDTEKILSKIVLQPNSYLTKICKAVQDKPDHINYFFAKHNIDLKPCSFQGDLQKLRKGYNHTFILDKINKYFVDNNEVDCMTFINTFENQTILNSIDIQDYTQMPALVKGTETYIDVFDSASEASPSQRRQCKSLCTSQVCGYNIVIDIVEHSCKLVKLNCIGCIFQRIDETIDLFNARLQTCFRCICCVNCYNCESCKYCFNSEMSRNCNNCVSIKFCNDCSYCIDCESCKSCNHCSLSESSTDCDQSQNITYSKSVKSCKRVSYSYDCKSSNEIKYCDKITGSNNICYSSLVNLSTWINHAEDITACDTCRHTSYAFECTQISYCACIKFCSSVHFSRLLYCCYNCQFLYNSMVLNNSQCCANCAIGKSILYCTDVYCCNNTRFCLNINKYIHDNLHGKMDLWVHTEESFNLERYNHEKRIVMDNFNLCIDKILCNLIPKNNYVGVTINNNKSIENFVENIVKIIEIVNNDPEMIFTPEEQDLQTDNKSVFNIQKIMEKIENNKKYLERWASEHSNSLCWFKEENNLFYILLKLFTSPWKNIELKDIDCQNTNINLSIDIIQSLFKLDLYYSKDLSLCCECDKLTECNNCFKCYNLTNSNFCNECDNCVDCVNCYKCYNSNQSKHCYNCLNMDSCQFIYHSDHCVNTRLSIFASYCLDSRFIYYDCPCISHNTENNTKIIDCSCGCGKRIEIDSNDLSSMQVIVFRVYDKENYLVYIGTTKLGFIYHELSCQIYKKCYFKKDIDVQKYFEDSYYFESMAVDNCLYVETYDRNGVRVN